MQANTRILGALALFATGFGGFAAGSSLAQETPSAKPGKQHEWLASHAGEYTAKVGGIVGESTGTNRIESALGGLWTITHFEAKLMGEPFKGIEIVGYDPLKEKFVSVWVDSLNPLLMTMEGTYDAGTKTLTMRGDSIGLDGEHAEMVNVTKYSEGEMAFTMNIEGVPTPMMTIESKRID